MPKPQFRSKIRAAGLFVASLVSTLSPAKAREDRIAGTIASFVCGDNCYLTVTADSGDEHVGLCAAPECAPWNEAAEMPRDLVGRRITAKVANMTETATRSAR